MRRLLPLAMAACYSPNPPAGAPCSQDRQCPDGFVCTTMNLCEPQDASNGGALDADSGCGWQTHFFDACAIPTSSGDLHLTSQYQPWSLDTDTGVFRGRMNKTMTAAMAQLDQGGVPVLLVSVDNFIVDSGVSLQSSGSRGLIIAANQSITVAGSIDVSASQGNGGGGSNPSVCATSSGGAGTDGAASAGGGGGGALQGSGGAGGMGNSPAPAAGGTAGVALAMMPTIVRGGCPGGHGGSSGGGNASTGAGGGALQLTAKASITIAGTITASGGGGGGGIVSTTGGGGGGGGGAGGFIGLESPMIDFTGQLAANGGAGGAGASIFTAGGAGSDGTLSASSSAGGTNPGGCGTAGGDGSSQAVYAGADVTAVDTCGGGGGGGGAGWVVVFGSISGGLITPPVVLDPF